MRDIFISYNWGSKETVQKIVDLLRSNDGYQVWMDDFVMKSGDQFRKEIQEGIDNCKIFIAFITKNYCDSLNCQSETHYAFDKKKKCIYVMLEENLGDDPTGIGLIVAPSLRLNAYQFVNHKDWPVNLYDTLSKDINNYLNNKTSPKLIDLDGLVICRSCNNRFNLEDSGKDSCRKPMQTNCNMHKLHENVLCMKCLKDRNRINSLGNSTFLCPFDRNEHLLTNCTDANSLHSIIKYFETRECFNNLKEKNAEYYAFKNKTENKIIEQVNESKRKIKEHFEEIVSELNKYVAQLVGQLDKHVNEWRAKQESIQECLKIDEIIKSTEESMRQLENDLKQTEIDFKINESCSIEKKVDENITIINDRIASLDSQLTQESINLRNGLNLNYKKGNKINLNDLNQVVGTFEVDWLYLVDIPEIVELCNKKEDNYLEISKLIEEKYANVNFKNKDGWTALILASMDGHLETVKLLIQNGANTNEKTKCGSAALSFASMNGHLEIVKLLIQNGANVNEKNKDGWTALKWAKIKGNKAIVKYLKSIGAK